MANWRYFEATGQVGGTTGLQYVDSFNGDDANPGTHLLPKQSIQGAFDALGTGGTMILAGYFNEGDWVSPKLSTNLVTEGYVIINGEGFSSFNWDRFGTSLQEGINAVYSLGRLEIKNYSGEVSLRGTTTSSGSFKNLIFNNCENISLGGGSLSFGLINTVILINSDVVFTSSNSSSDKAVKNILLINSTLDMNFTNTSTSRLNFSGVFADSNSVIDLRNTLLSNYNNNCILGTQTEKIRINNVWYENTEDVQANTSYAQDDLPSTTDPKFNGDCYTLAPDSPLRNAGQDRTYIGAYGLGNRKLSTESIWTLDNITLNTDNEFELTTLGVGTAESDLVEVSERALPLKNLFLPNFSWSPSTGETIGRLASAGTPYLITMEIQYSTDGVTTNGTWLRVPIGTKPFHDTVNNVGNDNADFNFADAIAIVATHLKYKITLRSDETPI